MLLISSPTLGWPYPNWANTYRLKYQINLYLLFFGYLVDTYWRRIRRVSVSDTVSGVDTAPK
uniref:Uncharacterized protein n=1 Tax=Arundo donax TaxID=35708 RepID=A0A0A9FY91_ARUDO